MHRMQHLTYIFRLSDLVKKFGVAQYLTKYLLTCGSDGDVRVWDGIDDDDAISHRAGDKAFCVLHKNGRFYTATDISTIQAHTFPDGAPDGILTRFTAPVNHMCLNKSGKRLVAGSSDFTVRVVDVDTCKHETLRGHEAPVLSVALDPQEKYVASSSCDGTVRVWSIGDQTQVKSLTLIPKCSDVSLSKTWCRLCWEKQNGKNLYVPVDKEIHIYERDTWNKVGTLKDPEFTDVCSVLEISPDGKHLAAGCYDGHILIFNLNSKKCVEKFKHERGFSIMSLAWNPKDNHEIAFCDKEGQLELLFNVIFNHQGQLGLLEEVTLNTTSDTMDERAQETMGIFDDDDDDLIQATNEGDSNKKVLPIIDDDSNDSTPSKQLQPLDDLDDLDSRKDGSDDDTNSLAEALQIQPQPIIPRDVFRPPPLQPPFQPGSSPVHLTSRYMMWNSVGIIKQFNTEDENSIDIEFHDTSIHHAMHITNTANYSMADMSTEAVVLACETEDDSPSKLMCMHFGSWDTTKEWNVSMPDEEEIQALTMGEDWIAVATSCRNVRLLTLGGIQKEMFSIPGPVVCMAGHTNQLIVVYHRGMALPGEQCLGVLLVNVDGKTRNVIGHEPLPLSVKATLSWIGFSAEGTPFYMDSKGVVRMCNRKFGPSWIQVIDTKAHTKGKSDNFFIVGVHENPQQLRCIPCKGSRYPPTLPRPAVGILQFQIPLCEMTTEKSQYEEILWRSRLFANHFDHWKQVGYEYLESTKADVLKPSQEALMKLFALSARSDREFRALEVCEMMPDPHTLQLAIKYASRVQHIQLAERISELAQRKMEEEAEEEEEEEDLRLLPRRSNYHSTSKQYGYCNGEQGAEDEVDVTMETEEGEEEEEDHAPSGPMLNLKPKADKPKTPSQSFASSGRSNPFKVQTPSKPVSGSTKGTQVFDSMSKRKQTSPGTQPIRNTKPVKLGGKKSSGQGKLFPVKSKNAETNNEEKEKPSTPTTQKAASAFDLWFEENKAELTEEHPDVSEEDLADLGAEKFRQLPKEDRQVWLQKARQLKSENTENQDNNTVSDKKRKRDADSEEGNIKKKKDDVASDTKKLLSENTNTKLSSFAFQKD
ncbi:hypothetical protein FSP39_017398 [Pinctada imbricata]|uniref:HMG box domain-containing protein n=1 Tax=Pinctada imbricata TaxID=66713 RepID=A0AA89C3Q5_PINIB|nr:hypothetical protein FSP39_017398 [Pinctada imbricata]